MRETLNFWCRCATHAAAGTVAFANDWAWLFGVPTATVFVSLLATAGGNTVTGSAFFDALLAGLAAFLITWLVIFFVRLIGAPAHLYKLAHQAIPHQLDSSIAKLVQRRDMFTITEAACLLACTEIRQDDVVGPASGYLFDIKKRVIAGKIKSNADSLEISHIKSQNESFLAIMAGQPRRQLRNDVEIPKASLAQLAKEFGVDIPGLELQKPRASRPNTIYQFEMTSPKLEGAPIAWAKTPRLLWAARADGARDIISVFIEGKNVEEKEIKLVDACLISGVTGTKLEMKIKAVSGRNVQWVSPSEVGLIPPGAKIEILSGELNGDEGIEEAQFSKYWGTFNFVFRLGDVEHRKTYDSDAVRAALEEEKLDPPEPYVALKD